MTYEEGGYGIFSIKYFYEKIFIRGIFSAYSVWIPRKICVFTWLAVRRVILTVENLKKGTLVVLVGASCVKNQEDT